MTPEEIKLVQATWNSVAPARKAVADLFQARLFELDASLRTLFAGDPEQVRTKFLQVVSATIRGLDRLDVLLPVLRELGMRHVTRGIRDEHYGTFATALLWTLEKALRADFTPQVKSAWIKTYGVLSQTMREAALAQQAA